MNTFPAVPLMLVCGLQAVLCVDGDESLSNSSGWMYLWGAAVAVVILFLFRLKDDPTVEILETYTVVMGERVKLKCSASAFPFIKSVSWQHIPHEGQTIELQIDQQKYVKTKSNHLVINKTLKTDQGEYVCTVSDWCWRKRTATTKLMVEGGPPAVNMNPSTHTKREGDDAILNAKVVAIPPPFTVIWSKEGRNIAIDNDKYFIGPKMSPALMIKQLEKIPDEGKYTVEARNIAGSGSNSVQLNVQSKTTNLITGTSAYTKASSSTLNMNPVTDTKTNTAGDSEQLIVKSPITRTSADTKTSAPTKKDFNREIAREHISMVNRLPNYIYPKLETKWLAFKQHLSLDLEPAELEGNLQDIVHNLWTKGLIKYGQYDILYDAVNAIDKPASAIIKETESRIKTIRERASTHSLCLYEPTSDIAAKYQPSKETTNFIRMCMLIVDIIPDLFRAVLITQLGASGLSSVLDKQKGQIFSRLNSNQKKILYPNQDSVFRGSMEDLDMSCLYIIIRNIGNTPPQRNGWGKVPEKADRTLSANIDRLRIQRNEVYAHAPSASLSDDDFQTRYNIIRQSVVDIQNGTLKTGSFELAVDNILTMSIDPRTENNYIALLAEIEGDIIDVKDRQDRMATVMEVLTGNVSSVKYDIIAVSGETCAIREDVRFVKDDVSTMMDDVSTVRDDVSTVREDVGAVRDDVGHVRDDVDAVKDELYIVKEQLNVKTANTARQDVMEANISEVATSQVTMTTKISEVATRQETMATNISEVATRQVTMATDISDVTTRQETMTSYIQTIRDDITALTATVANTRHTKGELNEED